MTVEEYFKIGNWYRFSNRNGRESYNYLRVSSVESNEQRNIVNVSGFGFAINKDVLSELNILEHMPIYYETVEELKEYFPEFSEDSIKVIYKKGSELLFQELFYKKQIVDKKEVLEIIEKNDFYFLSPYEYKPDEMLMTEDNKNRDRAIDLIKKTDCVEIVSIEELEESRSSVADFLIDIIKSGGTVYNVIANHKRTEFGPVCYNFYVTTPIK